MTMPNGLSEDSPQTRTDAVYGSRFERPRCAVCLASPVLIEVEQKRLNSIDTDLVEMEFAKVRNQVSLRRAGLVPDV